MIGAGGAGRPGRRRQPAQAGAGPRRAAHHRRHHLGRVQEVLREGRRRSPAGSRSSRSRSRARTAAIDMMRGLAGDAREAPRRAHPRRGGRATRSSSRTATSPAASSRTRRSACSTPPAPAWRSARTPSPPAVEDCRREIDHLERRDRHPRARAGHRAPHTTERLRPSGARSWTGARRGSPSSRRAGSEEQKLVERDPRRCATEDRAHRHAEGDPKRRQRPADPAARPASSQADLASRDERAARAPGRRRR